MTAFIALTETSIVALHALIREAPTYPNGCCGEGRGWDEAGAQKGGVESFKKSYRDIEAITQHVALTRKAPAYPNFRKAPTYPNGF